MALLQPVDLERYRRRLLAMRDQLALQLSGHNGDADSDRLEHEILEIDKAVDRINHGTYGICRICRDSISLQRLETLPQTALCADCEAKRDYAAK